MMRMHKLYHRLTLLSLSSPLSLPSNPSLLPLLPPLPRTLRYRTAANFTPMSTSRLSHITPLAAVSTEDSAGGASNGSVSPPSAADIFYDYEGLLNSRYC